MSAVPEPAIELRPMTEATLAAIHRIEEDLYDFPWSWRNFADSLAAGHACLEYWAAGVLTGYSIIMYAPDEAQLLNLSIAREHQRRGHGSRLLDLSFAHARKGGARALFLEVRPSNTAALALYDRVGFRRIGTRRGYYPARNGREDALILRYDLA